MFVSAVERDREFEPDAGLAFDEHPGLGARLRPWATAWQARRPACPFCTRFEPQGAVDPRGVAQPRHADPPVGALSAVNRKGSVSHRPLNWPVFTLTGRVSFALATFAFAPHRMGLEPRKSKHHKHLTPFPKQRVVMTGGAYGEPDSYRPPSGGLFFARAPPRPTRAPNYLCGKGLWRDRLLSVWPTVNPHISSVFSSSLLREGLSVGIEGLLRFLDPTRKAARYDRV